MATPFPLSKFFKLDVHPLNRKKDHPKFLFKEREFFGLTLFLMVAQLGPVRKGRIFWSRSWARKCRWSCSWACKISCSWARCGECRRSD